MKNFPVRFTTKDCKKDQYKINISLSLPTGETGLSTGWGDYDKCMVEIRHCFTGQIEIHHIQSLMGINSRNKLMSLLK